MVPLLSHALRLILSPDSCLEPVYVCMYVCVVYSLCSFVCVGVHIMSLCACEAACVNA